MASVISSCLVKFVCCMHSLYERIQCKHLAHRISEACTIKPMVCLQSPWDLLLMQMRSLRVGGAESLMGEPIYLKWNIARQMQIMWMNWSISIALLFLTCFSCPRTTDPPKNQCEPAFVPAGSLKSWGSFDFWGIQCWQKYKDQTLGCWSCELGLISRKLRHFWFCSQQHQPFIKFCVGFVCKM